jgi:hypothetical protein
MAVIHRAPGVVVDHLADQAALLHAVEQVAPARLPRAQRRCLAAAAHEAEMGGDARQQRARGNGFHEDVVGAGVQPRQRRLLAGAGRQQQHRRVVGAGVGPERAQQAATVATRHGRLGEDERRRIGERGFERGLAVGSQRDTVARGGEQVVQMLAHRRIVLDEEDPLGLRAAARERVQGRRRGWLRRG